MSYRDPSVWDRRARRQARREARWAGATCAGWPHDRIYRDTGRGWIAGVCAGIADYAGVDAALVRVAAVVLLIFFFVPVLIAYVVFAIVLKPKPPALFASPGEEDFWRDVRTEPGGALHGLNGRFRTLNNRLARMETLVTSDEFDLRRGFRDLGA